MQMNLNYNMLKADRSKLKLDLVPSYESQDSSKSPESGEIDLTECQSVRSMYDSYKVKVGGYRYPERAVYGSMTGSQISMPNEVRLGTRQNKFI